MKFFFFCITVQYALDCMTALKSSSFGHVTCLLLVGGFDAGVFSASSGAKHDPHGEVKIRNLGVPEGQTWTVS